MSHELVVGLVVGVAAGVLFLVAVAVVWRNS